MKQSKIPFALKSTPIVLAISALLSGCGGDSSSSNDDPAKTNNTPSIENASLVLKPGKTSTLQLTASDQDQDSLTYSIKTQPTKGTASIDANGLLTYTSVENGEYSIVIEVSDGTDTKTGTVNVSVKNSAPVGSDASITLPFSTPTGKVTYQVSATDHDGDTLAYSIKESATNHTATIDDNGMLTLTIADFTKSDSMQISVSDGEASSDMMITVKGHEATSVSAKSFKNQFYKVANPETGNSQIVHYNSETGDQNVIKSDVILGNKVFVMSGTKDGDKTTYTSREYGLFQDPASNFVTRTADDGNGGTYEYKHRTDHIIKTFEADNTANEKVLYGSDKLPQPLKSQGINVIDSATTMHLNEIDIDNSYVQVMAYSELADTIREEKPEDMLHVPITVRLSDSAQVNGRAISVIKGSDGKTSKVLMNYVAPHKSGSYPTDDASKKRLQHCDTALSNCTDITGGEGNFYLLTENDSHAYLTKDGSKTIYAFNKTDNALAAVTGVEYPAEFDHHHHLIKLRSTGGHGAGMFDNFFNLLDNNETLSEGNTAYVAINYDLDTKEATATQEYAKYGFTAHVHKHAMILRLTGTEGLKVYENGDGIDHMNQSNEEANEAPISYHLNMIAVKDGSLLLEASKFNGGATCVTDKNCNTYRQAWLDTKDLTTTKLAFDNEVIAHDLPYLTGFRVQPKAVGDNVYFTKRDGQPVSFGGTGVVYNIYKSPISDTSLAFDDSAVTHVLGRMLFERSAFRSSGIYDGTVILWNSSTGDITDATDNNKLLGNDSLVDPDDNGVSSVIGRTSTDNLSGIGGIFGLKISLGHPSSATYLTSGESGIAGSLKKVNQINGSWITD